MQVGYIHTYIHTYTHTNFIQDVNKLIIIYRKNIILKDILTKEVERLALY